MWLLVTMGCGRSKSASGTAGSMGTKDTDTTDFYQKASTGSGKKMRTCCTDVKASILEGDSKYRIKGKQINGDVVITKNYGNGKEQISGQLVQTPNITDSQIEFFKMLDERIEMGRDLDGSSKL